MKGQCKFMVQDVDQVPPPAEAPQGVDSLTFDARGSGLANELSRRDHVTGIALEQGCDLDMPVVVQRQAPMSQTVLGASAVTVHRQGHRNSSLHVETDLRGLNDSRSQSCSTLARAADSGNPRNQLILWCHRGRCRPSRRSRRLLRYSRRSSSPSR